MQTCCSWTGVTFFLSTISEFTGVFSFVYHDHCDVHDHDVVCEHWELFVIILIVTITMVISQNDSQETHVYKETHGLCVGPLIMRHIYKSIIYNIIIIITTTMWSHNQD